jgi:PAS domain S-box-containing protein
MQKLLVEAQALVGGTYGIVGRWNESDQSLDLLVSTVPDWRTRRRVGSGVGISGLVVTLRAPVIIDDYQSFDKAIPDLVQTGIRAALAAPLLYEGRLLGVVTILTDRPDKRFTSEDSDVLEILATIAAATLVGLERRWVEARLRLQTEHLERLTESTGDSVIVTDRGGRLLAWNKGAELMYGWTRREVLGGPMVFVPPDRRDEADQLWQRVLTSGEVIQNYETERVTKDGRRVSILATVAPVRDEAGDIVGVIGIAKDLTARKILEEQAGKLARLSEREAIAMDLHDHVMQALYGIVLSLGGVERMLDEDVDTAHRALRQANDQLNGVIRDLRSFLYDDQRRGPAGGALARALGETRGHVRPAAQYPTPHEPGHSRGRRT